MAKKRIFIMPKLLESLSDGKVASLNDVAEKTSMEKESIRGAINKCPQYFKVTQKPAKGVNKLFKISQEGREALSRIKRTEQYKNPEENYWQLNCAKESRYLFTQVFNREYHSEPRLVNE